MFKGIYLDDNFDKLQIIEELLESTTSLDLHLDPRTALKKLSQTKYDFIITDLMMPYMDGFEFLDTIKKDHLNPDAKVFILSSTQEDKDKQRSFSYPIDDFLSFDMSLEEIKLRILHALKKTNINYNNITYNNISLDSQLGVLQKNSLKAQLTPSEVRIIKVLFSSKGYIQEYQELVDQVWSDSVVRRHTVNSHMFNLNKKLIPFKIRIGRIENKGFQIFDVPRSRS